MTTDDHAAAQDDDKFSAQLSNLHRLQNAPAAPEEATPRTDSMIQPVPGTDVATGQSIDVVHADDCSTLERENADLRRQLDENANATRIGNEWIANSSLEIWFPITAEELQRLKDRAERAESEARRNAEDAERYRWLRDSCPVAEVSIDEMIFTDPDRTDAAIDAARSKK